MITIDGSLGEGGGQVLRTALGLSAVTGTPFAIERIRAGRKKPGLQRQHLAAVLAVAEVTDADVQSADIGSQQLTFRPGAPRAGYYRFAIGTAGSTTLVLQAVLPALWAAPGASTVAIEGGTHNPLAPPVDFLASSFAPLAARMGAPLRVELVRHGFFPAGGGMLRAEVGPANWRPLTIERSGRPLRIAVRIVDCGLPAHVAERERAELCRRLHLAESDVVVERVPSPGPGNAVLVALHGEHVTEVIVALAERQLSAEAVAERAARAARRFVAGGVPVGEHLADQLLVPMALAGGGSFVTGAPSEHTRTNAQVVERFLPVRIRIETFEGAWRVEVEPR